MGALAPMMNRQGNRHWLRTVLALTALALASHTLAVTLAWNASMDASVVGYYLYFGPASRSYIAKIDVGNQTAYSVESAVSGQAHYFAATAYNADRVESAYSNEVALPIPPPPVNVVEFYNANLDHYFMTAAANDISDLDGGLFPGWTRTGYAFQAYSTAAVAERSPVCRYYIPPVHGDSHFFSAFSSDCAFLRMAAANPADFPSYSGYVEENSAAFFVALPDAIGTCPAGTVPVYRLWNQRFDSNHRFTTDPAVKAQMIVRGYVAEGYGPDAVSMCAPT